MHKLLVIGLCVAACLAFAPGVRAADPIAVASESDTVAPCLGTGACAVVGIGDFNGDGRDDLLTFDPIGSSRATTAYQELGIYYGGAVGASSRTSRIELVARVGTRVSVDDVNGDGIDDIVLSGARISAQRETLRVVALFGRADFPLSTDVGELQRGDLVVHRSDVKFNSRDSVAPNVTALFGDLNGDDEMDLVLGRDPAATVSGRGSVPLPRDGKSEAFAMFGDGSWSGRIAFRTDVTVTGLGRCAATLAALGDATGDGIDDMVVRRCAAHGMPDLPGLVPGAPSMTGLVPVLGALPEPSPEEPGPRGPSDSNARGSSGSGYVSGGASLTKNRAVGSLVSSPVAALEDLNEDGTNDVVMDLVGRVHVWHGGPDIAARMANSESSGILVNASFSSTQLSGGWSLADLDGDDGAEFVTARTGISATNHSDSTPSSEALVAFDVRTMGNVVDTRRNAPKLTWLLESVFWGLGDFNGDGHADLLSTPFCGTVEGVCGSADGSTVFSIHYGPFAASVGP